MIIIYANLLIMKAKLLFSLFFILFMCNMSFAQNSDVQITVKWASRAYENKIEVYNTANDLITTICDDNQCYMSSQAGVTGVQNTIWAAFLMETIIILKYMTLQMMVGKEVAMCLL